MPKNLLIVESPAKAKTIEKYLGKDFKVKSSMGHVRDLIKGNGAVDIENNFEPSYVVSPEKTKVVKDLKEWVKKVDEVWLATDEDREGEAISWHLCKVLGLDEHSTKRIVFREITKPAIQKAIQVPRKVDLNLVDAQQARRILDRLVGFELSELLWRKVKSGLSAGRVQSVAVRLVVQQERSITEFDSKPFYRINAIFDVKNKDGKKVALKAELPSRYDSQTDAETFLNKCIPADFKIEDIQVRPLKRKPTAPFTTSTLQQEASRKLYFNVKRTMMVAQKLYEQGHITYMRTDSTNLSELAVAAIAQEIEKNYGKKYIQTRQYKGKKNANAQEAHEAIRPTYVDKQIVTQDRDQQRLYELIWKRTVASQMADAQLEKTTVKIGVSTIPDATLNATGEVLKFEGFLKVYIESTDDEEEEAAGMLPPLKLGQRLDLNEMTATERFTRPPARFTEASLVKKLEELGIGRPSTYAPTISKIMEEKRGYVIKGDNEGTEREYNVIKLKHGAVLKRKDTEKTGSNKNRLVPTDMGMVVTDFLANNFDTVMNYGFTADIEGRFDAVADGKEQWTSMLGKFYHPFHETVQETLEKAGRATGERFLGTDAATGHTILVRMNKFGRPMAQIGKPEELAEEEKPRYANLNYGQSIETITLEEAIDLFQLPKDLGEYKGESVTVANGRFGPYVKFGEKYVSIPRSENPLEVGIERAQELIDEKLESERPVGTYKGISYTKGKGRFGPFLKYDKFFVNVPKRYDFENLSQEDAHDLIAKKIEKEANRYIHRWEELDLSVQNGRWGPFIKWKKKNVKIPKINDEKATSESAKELTLEQVQEWVKAEHPEAFKPKKKRAPAKKKTVKKKTTTTKKK